jgi:hypothetical protein
MLFTPPDEDPRLKDKIKQYVQTLSEARLSEVFNPWGESCQTELDPAGGPTARCARLIDHLSISSPKLILMGEAAGYRGCRYSGVTFTSEKLLLDGVIPRIEVVTNRITRRTSSWSEPSATIVWGMLYELGIAESVVMSNAFPWHPEGKKGRHSNRTPTSTETSFALPYLETFLDLYPEGTPVVAVGDTAYNSLNKLGITCEHVRHPAYGGANKFRSGLAEIINRK